MKRTIQQEQQRLRSMLQNEHTLWQQGIVHIAGVDEVGAGPLAGPVVAAAVILKQYTSIDGIDDSKRLTARKRQQLAYIIKEVATAWSIGCCSIDEIDTINIYQASGKAMQQAVATLATQPQHILGDARRVPHCDIPQTPIIRGDTLSQSIAAASIIAKVYRDALMDDMARIYPGYGFEKNRGYGTAQHMAALQKLGPCPEHRKSFAPVTKLLHTTLNKRL